MKRTLLLLVTVLLVLQEPFSQAKRYIFLEHFTNSRCGICASVNPGFFNLLESYKNKYHHMKVHPPIPYSACLLYQANKEDNVLRSNFYGVVSTPTLVINGLSKKSLGSVNAATLDAELNKLSPIEIIVKESGTNQRTANVEIKTVGLKPGGNYRIYAAALEKELNYTSPNGEKIHHNVFRDFLSAADGDPIDLAVTGSSVSKTFSITLQPGWVESEMYILVWIQDTDTKEVLNSGTKYDALSSADNIQAIKFSVYPNPVKEMLKIDWPNTVPSNVTLSVTNLWGKEIYTTNIKAGTKNFQYPVSHFQKGIYFVRIQSGNDKLTRKWIKD